MDPFLLEKNAYVVQAIKPQGQTEEKEVKQFG